MLLLDTGARRDELMSRKLTDLDLELDVLLVLGKGRRERALPFGRKSAAEQGHAEARRLVPAGSKPEPSWRPSGPGLCVQTWLPSPDGSTEQPDEDSNHGDQEKQLDQDAPGAAVDVRSGNVP